METVDAPGRVAIAAAVAIGPATRSGAAGMELGAADRDLRRRALPTPRAEQACRRMPFRELWPWGGDCVSRGGGSSSPLPWELSA